MVATAGRVIRIIAERRLNQGDDPHCHQPSRVRSARQHAPVDERATYLLGLAVRRHLEKLAPDFDHLSTEATRTLETIGDWLDDWLDNEEFFHVDYTMGHAFRPDIRHMMAQ